MEDVKVDITGDPSKFKDATVDATRALQEFTAAVKKYGDEAHEASQQGAKLGVGAISVGTAIGQMAEHIVSEGIRAMSDLVASSVEQQDAFYKLSQATGISTEALSGWADGARKENISLSELSTGLRNLAKNFAEAQGGRGDGGRLFKALDIDVNNFRTLEDLVPVVAQRIAELHEGANKTDLVRLLIGPNPEKFTEFFNKGADGLVAIRLAAREAGNEISGETARAAAELNDQLDEMRAHIRGLGNDIATWGVPKLNEFFNRWKSGTILIGGLRDALKELQSIQVVNDPIIARMIAALDERLRQAKPDANSDARDRLLNDGQRGKKDASAIGKAGKSDAEREYDELVRETNRLRGTTEGGRAEKLQSDIETLSRARKAGIIDADQEAETVARLNDVYTKSTWAYKQAIEEQKELHKSREDGDKEFDKRIEDRSRAELKYLEQQNKIEVDAAKNMAKITAELDKDKQKKADDYRASLDKLISPTVVGRAKELHADIDLLNMAMAKGDITSEEYNQALNKVQKEFLELGKGTEKTAKDIIDAIEGTGRRTSRAFAEMAVAGRASFQSLGDAAREFATEIIDSLLYRQTLKPLADMIGTSIGSLFTQSQTGSNNFGYYSAPTKHTGGIVGVESTGSKVVSMAAFQGARRMHSGGIAGDEVPTILKKREGVFTPEQMKMLSPVGGTQSIRVEIVNQGTPQQVQSAQPTFDVEGAVIRIITKDIKNGGPMSQSMQGAYGLRRSGG